MGVAVDSRARVYVAALASQLGPGPPTVTLSKVDASRGSVTAILVPRHHPNPASSVIVLNGSLWMTAGSEVWRVDPATGKVLNRVRIEQGLGELLADPEGSSVWLTTVASGGEVGWVYQIDASAGRIVSQQPIGCCPGAIAIGNGYVWLTNSRDGTVQRISQTTGDVVPPITVGRGVNSIAVGEGGVWVTVDS